ncbi:2OG-Fe oxygenase superfamily protein [Drechmeria coniospora]|uniref:2OG-Fe oxygenase superfamily protein n=1 Tax=Drechmeria coniospora TaxID=98403 RepID=A0A151GA91_DRECN|nr:2OG-Fe oxygenase superfamily protein [Drechmeria coniospora]KYK54001.1 2OG-Fe oxygenase superfamily protein [Drechmeria coniospora]
MQTRELLAWAMLAVAGVVRAEADVPPPAESSEAVASDGVASDGEASEPAAPISIIPDDYTCVHPPYRAHIFSQSPLIVYLENFITPDERVHLQAIAYVAFSRLSCPPPPPRGLDSSFQLTSARSHGKFQSSVVLNPEGRAVSNSVRSSQSTTVKADAVVRCVEARALDFQGFDIPAVHVEGIQLVKYAPTQQYLHHTDWLKDPHKSIKEGGNRISSFFGSVKAVNVTGGGTNFPLQTAPTDSRWCRFVDCDQPYDAGVTFRPIEGNVVYWNNLHEDGRGDDRTLHAGLPVVSGEKIGINIWTRQAAVPDWWRN